ncbi:MAG: zinc transporter ZupT [Rothia sp. (in: high G+C Gram-positive bacteria)]|nr:zinc transporter ZupT [Rothia sp. (in: high G+C Gram-positive bacteria)]
MTAELFAFTLTLGAGAATGLGAALVLVTHRNNPVLLSAALGFSAGVMVYVSFLEILPKATETLSGSNPASASALATTGFFGGVLLAAVIDRLMPEAPSPQDLEPLAAKDAGAPGGAPSNQQLKQLGLFTALALALHNFPEGIATFLTGLADQTLAIPLAVAIGIHNIPEGIAVAIPLYYATGSRTKAFWWALASGLTEPLGALLGWLILGPVLTDALFGVVFAMVAGIMVFISLDKLLPAATRYGSHKLTMQSMFAGMAVMALSLLILN